MATASFIARTPEDANRFMQGVLQQAASPKADFSTNRNFFSEWIWSGGLTTRAFQGIHPTSQTRRELLIHERQHAILQQTREYLTSRSPLASFVVNHPARITWHHLPRTYDPRLDAFLAFLRSIGAPRAISAADRLQARDGAAMLYIDAPGHPSTPLTPQTGRWRRLVPIPLSRINDGEEASFLDESGDPLLAQHGFEFVDVVLSPKENAESTLVHGSRLIAVNDDPRSAGDWWWTPPVLDTLHDTLWDHLDVTWSRKRLHFEGDPIMVEVPMDNEFLAESWQRLEDGEQQGLIAKVRDALRLFMRSGKSSNLATVAGFKTTRLGHADMPDPTADYRAIASMVSNAMGGYPVSVIISSSKGSERVDDADVKAEATWTRNRRGEFAEPLMDHMFLAAKRSGILAARAPVAPAYFWPEHHVLSPNDRASSLSITTKALRTAWELGKQMPVEIDTMFPDDPDVELPPIFALRGRNEDGSSVDPPMPPSGGSGARPLSQAQLDAIEELIEAELEEAAADRSE